MSAIRTAFHFPNGNVACCDEWGQQLPEFQGQHWNVIALVLENSDDETEFYDYRDGIMSTTRESFAMPVTQGANIGA